MRTARGLRDVVPASQKHVGTATQQGFEKWLRAVIRKSPTKRTLRKSEILDVAFTEFGMTAYAAGIIRARVIATLENPEARRVWSSPGRSGG